MEEVVRWRRAQRQARQSNIERLSPAEYLDSFMGIVKPLSNSNRVLNTIISLMEADSQYNDPSDKFVMDCEDKIISQIKAMRAGNAPKNEAPPVVMHVTGMSSDRDQLKPPVPSDVPAQETPHDMAKVQGMLTEMSKTMTELKEKQGVAANVVRSEERYGRKKGDAKGGGKGKNKGQFAPKMEFPANTMCEYIDQGIACPLHDTPEGCPNLHPEDGMEANREKKKA